MFEDAEVQKGLETGILLKVSKRHTKREMKREEIISSLLNEVNFTVRQVNDVEGKGRLVINLSKVSKFWKKGS